VAFRALAECLDAGPHTLEVLDVSDNAVQAGMIREALWPLLSRQRGLRVVRFQNCGISGEAAEEIRKALCGEEGVPPSSLRELWFYNNMSGDEGGAAIAALARQSPGLELLRVSTTRVGRAGGRALADAVGSLRCLRELDVADNIFGDEFGAALGAALCVLPPAPLVRLDISDVNLGDAGVEGLARALVSVEAREGGVGRVLCDLGLGANEITAQGALAVEALLQTLPALERLALPDNDLENVGLRAVARGMQSRTTRAGCTPLRHVDVSRCLAHGRGVESVIEAAPQGACVAVDGNAVSDETLERVRARIEARGGSLGPTDDIDAEGAAEEVPEDEEDDPEEPWEIEDVASGDSTGDDQLDEAIDALGDKIAKATLH
jgi:Ran GTPase-activating protein (RanGAP) involved in mRNA processing and transport